MGRTLAAAAIILAAVYGAHGKLIAYEGFDYAPGDVSGKSGGIGWRGGWFGSSVNSTDNAVASGGLTFAHLGVSGNRMEERGADVRSFRRIDTAKAALADLVEDGPNGKTLGRDGTTIWIAFLVSCDSYPAVAYGGIHLCDGLGDLTKDPFGDKRAHQRMSMGRQNIDTHWYLGRVTNGAPGKGAWASNTVADSTVRLLVYRFDFKKGAEEAWMWIDPATDKEPAKPAAAIHAENVTDFRFNTLSAGAGPGTKFLLDEIRIGTEFADVAPRDK